MRTRLTGTRKTILKTMAVALLLLLPLLLPTSASGSDSKQRKKADRHFSAGEKARDKGDFAKAEREYADAIRLDPLQAHALYGLGQVQMATKRYSQALETFLRSKQAFVDAAQRDAEETQARRDYDIRRTRDRIRSLRSETMKGGGAANTEIVLLQERLLALEQPIDHLTDFETPAAVSLALGSACLRLGRGAEAEREFLAAITADPNLGEAHNNLAALYFMGGLLEEATNALERAESTGFRVHPQLKADLAAARAKASK